MGDILEQTELNNRLGKRGENLEGVDQCIRQSVIREQSRESASNSEASMEPLNSVFPLLYLFLKNSINDVVKYMPEES